jgi:TetR/AcrR family transcriptional regulator, cholesterol catabolism regulator
MVQDLVHEAPRRWLTERQAEAVDQLVDAAELEVEATGYDGLSVRNVARRAGVAPATAYTYFSSKDHLLAELLWRNVATVAPPATDPSAPLADRVVHTVEELGAIIGRSPALVAACTQALLSSNPDVKGLRDRIGAAIRRRLAAAVGPDGDPEVVSVLLTTYFGAMLMAGMGHMTFAAVPGFVADAARLMTAQDASPAAGNGRRNAGRNGNGGSA